MDKIYKLYSQSHLNDGVSTHKERCTYYSNKDKATEVYKALKRGVLDKYGKYHPTIIEKNTNFKLFTGALNSWIEIDLSEVKLIN